ncbi:MAG TPA: cytochrome c biogenesis protein ResB [Nocardioidaceae bacterium]|nr:cytochrome c biogenesis protein ResB [Nocardioidaceae bacterium]
MKPRSDLAVAEPTGTSTAAPPPPAGGEPVVPALKPVEFARWIWRQLCSMRTALVLLFLLAVAAIPGSLIPQERVDPSAVFAFRHDHPGLTPLFDRVGMFNVYSSPWFSAVYLLLMISLLGCIIPRLQHYARAWRARPPRAPRNLSRLSAYETWATDRPAAEVAAAAAGLLRSRRHRVDAYASGADQVVAAEKGYLREAGNLLFHCAVVAVLVGFAVTSLFGFKASVAVVSGQGFSDTPTQFDDFTPGGWYNIDNLPPFTFKVTDFHVAYKRTGGDVGMPLYFNAGLAVRSHPGATPYRYLLRVNHPLQVDGVAVYLVGHGYAPVVTVRDGHGNVAFSGPVVFLPQDGTFTSYGVVKAPDAKPDQLGFEGYFFPTGALTPTGQPFSAFPGPDNPILTLVGYHGNLGLDSGAPQSVYVLDKTHLKRIPGTGSSARPLALRIGQTVKLADGMGSIRFDGLKPWVKLQVNKQPGKLIPLVGVLAALVGLLGSLFIRPRRTWVRVRESEGRTLVEVAALDRVGGGDPESHVRALSGALREKEQA